MGILDRICAKQAALKAEAARIRAVQAERAAAAVVQQQQEEEAAQKARLREILGPDLADFDVTTGYDLTRTLGLRSWGTVRSGSTAKLSH